MQQHRRWHIYQSSEELEVFAAQALARAAAQAIESAGHFSVVLAGGTTPRRIYERLAQARANWAHWHVYFGDERCRPAGDSERNDHMAHDAWLKHVAIPPAQIRAIPAELGPEEAARRYAEALAPIERFDVVMLGLGEDGHTASLFPGRAHDGAADVLAVRGAPKPPPERVSLSASRLSRASQVIFVVSGETKRAAVARWRRGDALPASAIVPGGGVDILLDAAAWPDRFGVE